MAAKKKKRPRKKRAHAHVPPPAPHAKPRRRRRAAEAHGGGRAVPAGMVMVPVEALGSRPRRKQHGARHHHAHHPHKRNPEGHTRVVQAGMSVGAGLVAAAAGILGGYMLSRAGMTSKAANVAANLGAAAVIGGGLGVVDRTAGTVVAHNYGTAALQWLLARKTTDPGAGDDRVLGAAPMRAVTGAPRAALRAPVKAMHGVDELEGYTKLEGVIADDMGEPDALEGYAKLEGVLADNMGEPDALEGVLADDMGEPADLEGDEEMGELDDIGEPDLF